MGKFDENLKVTSKNISFYSTVWHFFSPTLFWRSKGKEKEILGAWETRKEREEGGRKTHSSPRFSLVRGLAHKFPSLPFRIPATQASDNQVIL